MLVGRTFSYSDTQRYRVGPNYLQLPVNPPKSEVATNQRDGRWPTTSTTAARTRTSTTSRRSPAGCARPRADARRAGPGVRGPGDRARSRGRTTTRRPVSATCSPSSGRRTTSSPTSSTRWPSATGPSRSGWSGTCTCARTSWASGSATASASRWTTSGTSSRCRRSSWTTRSAPAENLGHNGTRDVSGLAMTHCVPNERDALADQPVTA